MAVDGFRVSHDNFDRHAGRSCYTELPKIVRAYELLVWGVFDSFCTGGIFDDAGIICGSVYV